MRPVKSAAHQPSSAAIQITAEYAPPSSRAGIARRPRKSVTSLRCRTRRIDRQVDGVAAGSADEARERATDEKEEGHDVGRVAHPGGDEAMERQRHPADHERDEPGDEHGQQGEHATRGGARSGAGS